MLRLSLMVCMSHWALSAAHANTAAAGAPHTQDSNAYAAAKPDQPEQAKSVADLPSFSQVQQDYRASESWLLDRDGQRIQRIRTDFTARRGDWIALSEVSPALLHAIVLTEDKRFYEHSGVDWNAVTAAAWANVWNERTRGASTITMQLAGLLQDHLRSTGQGRSWRQKWDQLWAARDLESRWSKAQVLEAYLNLVPFRGELIGIDALSHSLFAKAPHGLDQRESAIAAAMLRAPNASPARIAERACVVLQQAQSPWGQDCKAMALFTDAALRNRHFEASAGDAPHFARYQIAQWRNQAAPSTDEATTPKAHLPTTFTSSLDGRLQREATYILREHLGALQGRNVQDGAVLVLDNASGEVLAWVGSSGQALSQASEVDAVLALRQPGSTLKPFLYAQAIEQKRLTAASLLDDSPASIPTEFGIYAPENYDLGYKGWVSVRQALGSSLNIPAVRALQMVSPDAFAQNLRELGFSLPQPSGFYGYSLALGGVDVSLLQLTNAYRTLANAGVRSAVQTHHHSPSNTKAAEAETVIDPRVAFIVSDMLADRHARMLTFGTDSQLATRFWSAVKTGTSKDMRDNWAMGYTSHFTIGVWVGNADGSPMQDVSGISGAAPVWAAVAAAANRLSPSMRPTAPPDLIQLPIEYRSESDDAGNTTALIESNRHEWFLPGTEQKLFLLANSVTSDHANKNLEHAGQASPAGKIIRPTTGTIFALDPDIPPDHQMLQMATQQVGAQWWINRKRVIGLTNPQRWYWAPSPGKFQIELRSAQGQVLDQVAIEVRGAEWKTNQ